MLRLSRWIGSGILLAVAVIVLTPMLLSAGAQLLVPAVIVVAAIFVLRALWYWTSL